MGKRALSGKPKFAVLLSIVMLFLISTHGYAQTDDGFLKFPDSLNKKRLRTVVIAEGALIAGSMAGLYALWYKDYPMTSFHFFNDNDEWLQMDKAGHLVTSYYISRIGYTSLRWSGVDEKRAILYGGSLGFLFQSTIEILDGFSAEWGASTGDIIANTAGSLIFMGQQFGWGEQRITLKYSFHPTEYPDYRPDLLGSNIFQWPLKDYNGQTYWLSTNIKSFFKGSNIPEWLNVSFGYSADGMTGARENSTEYKGQAIPHFERRRQFLLSLDVDLPRIKTRSKFLKAAFNLLGFIKVPFPALEMDNNGHFHFHPIYF